MSQEAITNELETIRRKRIVKESIRVRARRVEQVQGHFGSQEEERRHG
jgi:hypothetical protein